MIFLIIVIVLMGFLVLDRGILGGLILMVICIGGGIGEVCEYCL